MANYANLQNFGDPRAADWQAKNLMMIKLPSGQSWQVDRQAAPAFQGLLQDLVAAGYTPTSSGGFNYRTIRGSDKLSQHAFGNAIDINAAANPRLLPGQAVVTDLPSNIGDIAARHNIEWGGTWKRPDAMHFEWRGPQDGSTAVAQMPTQAVPSLPNGAGTLPQTAGASGSSIAALYSQPADASGVQQMATAADPSFGLAALFTQQQNARQLREQQRQDEEQARRQVLFGGSPGIASLYA